LEQTSTTISLRVERVAKLLPHDEQRTVASASSGWMLFKGSSFVVAAQPDTDPAARTY
jgi:hypothetical protein